MPMSHLLSGADLPCVDLRAQGPQCIFHYYSHNNDNSTEILYDIFEILDFKILITNKILGCPLKKYKWVYIS